MSTPSPTASAAVPSAHRGFPSLDGYRAVAALAVLVHHVSTTSHIATQHTAIGEITGKLGNYGVAVFFVLSGFLLYRPFVDASFRNAPSPRWRSFWWRRALRIYPAYWVAFTAAVVLVEGRRHIEGAGQWIAYVTLMQNYRGDAFTGGVFVAWTLSIEVSFYLLLPLLAAMLCRIGQGSTSSIQRRLTMQLAGLGALYAAGIAFRYWAAAASPSMTVKPVVWLPTFLDWYALGMALAVARCWHDAGYQLPKSLRALVRSSWLCLIVAASLYGVTLIINIPNDFAISTDIGRVMTLLTLNGLSASFLLLPGFLGPAGFGVWRQLLQTKWFVALGLISYGIFLWHPIAIDKVNEWSAQNKTIPAFLPVLLIVGAVAITAASVSFFVIERPTQRLRNLFAPPGTEGQHETSLKKL